MKYLAVALGSIAIATPAPAQKLVDPASVAPEFREAAEKRRAEQVRQRDCAQKADAEKIMPGDRTAFLIHCLESAEAKQARLVGMQFETEPLQPLFEVAAQGVAGLLPQIADHRAVVAGARRGRPSPRP